MVGHEFGIVAGLGFGGWDASESMHEALLVEPGDIVGGEVLDIAQGVQRAAAKRRIRSDAFVLVEPDGGLGQRVVIRIPDTATDGRNPERLSVSPNLTLVYCDPASL